MGLFVIGDVHGCYHTLLELMTKWNPEKEILIQIGDLIDRGLHSAQVVCYFQDLQKKYGLDKVVVLLGNHERECIHYVERGSNENWLRFGGQKTLDSFSSEGVDLRETCEWFKKMPLKWENENIFCSHAGISSNTEDPYNLDTEESVIWTRSPLLNLGKLQIVGHTPMRNGQPHFSELNNVWYIDTGAFLRLYLTGMKLQLDGTLTETLKIHTDSRDLP